MGGLLDDDLREGQARKRAGRIDQLRRQASRDSRGEAAAGASRLVTLTGIGGVGKTRLALRVAEDSRRSFTDGVWCVVLGELHDSALLAETVAATLGLPDQPGRSMSDLLIDHLSTRQTLLVLDNCEHLLGAVAELAQRPCCEHVRSCGSWRQAASYSGWTASACCGCRR